MRLFLSLLSLLLFFGNAAFAQPDSRRAELKDSLAAAKDKKLIVSVLPFVSSGPTTGFLYGISASLAKYFGPVSTTHLSTAAFGAIRTAKNQTFFTFKSTVFSKDDDWYLMGDWRYLNHDIPNWGLGTGPSSQKLASSTGFNYTDDMWSTPISVNQQIAYTHIRFHETVMKRVKQSSFFVGAGYKLDIHNDINDKILDLNAQPPVITSHYAYSIANGFDPERYALSSITIDAVYDTRDNSANAYTGRYANISERISPELLGSSKSSSSLWLEYRDYLSLSKVNPRHLLAFWAYGHFLTSGTPGYLDLAASGFDQYSRSARPYTQGRFRGQNLVYAETEYRFPIINRCGGVLFLNGSTASNKDANINLFDYVDPGYGFGLRWMLNKKSRTNVTIEYGFGKYGATGLIFNLGETF